MALRTVTPVAMTINTRTLDLVAGADLSATIADGDTFQIVVPKDNFNLIVAMSFAGTTTLTFSAGSTPPSMRAGLGSITIAGANGEVRLVPLEGGRFINVTSAIMTILGSNAGSNVKMAAYYWPVHGLV